MLQLNPKKEFPPVAALQSTGWLLELSAAGQSMEPFIRQEDVVSVRCVSAKDLKIGDVICYKDGDSFVLHRIIDRDDEKQCFLEKGDAVTRGRWIPEADVLGVLELINGKPFDNAQASKAARLGRKEQHVSDQFARLKLTVPPSVGNIWRKIKSMCGRP